jgi:hypothetical protein
MTDLERVEYYQQQERYKFRCQEFQRELQEFFEHFKPKKT